MQISLEKEDYFKEVIEEYRDFPKQGVIFKDISRLLADPERMLRLAQEMSPYIQEAEALVCLDARGFIFGSYLAALNSKPILMCRKKGKLPGKLVEQSCVLEYSEVTLELRDDIIPYGSRVVIIDDVLATGGTVMATIKLVERAALVVDKIVEVMEIVPLGGRDLIEKEGYKVYSLLKER